MSLSYGFYNSVNNDRLYNAEDFSSIFDGIINDGIYMSIGNKLMVEANENMTIKIGKGRAWFNHTWTYNDSYYNMELEPSHPILNRIDAVVLEIDHSSSVRANSFKIVKGEDSSTPNRPELINTSDVHQYALAYININAGASAITADDIINMVGTNETPYVTGVVDMVSIDDLADRLSGELDKKQNKVKASTTDLTPGISELPTNDIYVVYE